MSTISDNSSLASLFAPRSVSERVPETGPQRNSPAEIGCPPNRITGTS